MRDRVQLAFGVRLKNRFSFVRSLILIGVFVLVDLTAGASYRPELRIYPLGDSITRGKDNEGYRSALYQIFHDRGGHFRFVGSLSNGPHSLPERHHEGHNGWVIQQITDHVDEWLTRYRPDIILLMIGSNDIEGDVDLTRMPERFQNLLEKIIEKQPKAKLYVSEISLIRDPDFDVQAIEFNLKIEAMVDGLRARGNPVEFVPMHDVLTLDEIDSLDHPNAIGNKKMADRWAAYIQEL